MVAQWPAFRAKPWDGLLRAYVDYWTQGGERVDHGDVSGPLTVVPGTHEMVLTGDTSVTVNGVRDVTLWVSGSGAPLTVAGSTFTVNGEHLIVFITTSPTGVVKAFMSGSASSGGGGSDTEVTPVEPTWDDTAQTFTVPSIAGVIYSLNGTPVTGTVNAGAGEVTVTTAPALGYTFPVGADTSWTHTFPSVEQDLHSLLMSYEAPIYARMSRGSLEQFGTASGAWVQEGSGTLTFDGPAMTPNATGSGKFRNGERTLTKSTNLFAGEQVTVVAIVHVPLSNESGCNFVHFLTATDYEYRSYMNLFIGTAGYETVSSGSTHTLTWTRDASGTQRMYRDGVMVNGSGWDGSTWAMERTPNAIGIRRDPRDLDIDLVWAIPTALTGEQIMAIATAADTVGNPR